MELREVLDIIKAQQEKAGRSQAWGVGDQLADILREAPAAAVEIVGTDLTKSGMGIADCEKKIHARAKQNGGYCSGKEADRIIREFYGIAGFSTGAVPAVENVAANLREKHPSRRTINLADFM